MIARARGDWKTMGRVVLLRLGAPEVNIWTTSVGSVSRVVLTALLAMIIGVGASSARTLASSRMIMIVRAPKVPKILRLTVAKPLVAAPEVNTWTTGQKCVNHVA